MLSERQSQSRARPLTDCQRSTHRDCDDSSIVLSTEARPCCLSINSATAVDNGAAIVALFPVGDVRYLDHVRLVGPVRRRPRWSTTADASRTDAHRSRQLVGSIPLWARCSWRETTEHTACWHTMTAWQSRQHRSHGGIDSHSGQLMLLCLSLSRCVLYTETQ